MSKRGKKRLCSILHTMHAGNWGGVAMRIIIPLAALPLLLSRGGEGGRFSRGVLYLPFALIFKQAERRPSAWVWTHSIPRSNPINHLLLFIFHYYY